MKNISLFLSILAVSIAAVACDPMAKINKELDEKEAPISKKTEYTLTLADYSSLAGTYVKLKMGDFKGTPEEKKELEANLKKEASTLSSKQAFNEKASADLLVPTLLANKFPEWGKGSMVTINYNKIKAPSDNLKKVWNSSFVELDEKTLTEMGLSSMQDVKEETIEAIANKAKEKGAKTESILVKLSFKKGKRYLHILGKSTSDPKVYIAVQSDDYYSMGLKYGSFSASAQPDDYIPNMLAIKFPYAKEGTSIVVLYVWYAKKTNSARGSEYTLMNGKWMPRETTETKSDQFLHNGKQWLFDPTIVLTLGAEDFTLLYNYVKENHPNYISKKYPKNEEYWFGSSGYYKNFNLDGGETVGERTEEKGLSPEALLKAREERIKEGLKLVLKARYPNLPAQVNGVDQFYVVKATIRVNRNNESRSYRFKGLGDNKYEWVK